MLDKIIINVDGASRGNPGPAAIGVIIKDKQGKTLTVISQSIGVTTNNQAEYRALIAGLSYAKKLDARQVEVRSDSELMVKQVKGEYRVRKAELQPLYLEVRRLASAFSGFTICHIPREQNAEADRLANEAFGGEK